MIPVPEKFLTEINNKTIDQLREFNNDSEKNNYIYLLNKEMEIIDSINKNNSINKRAQKLYYRKLNYPQDRISKRCCEFKKLEEICDLHSD